MRIEERVETSRASVIGAYLMRVQIPSENVDEVLDAVIGCSSLEYGNYEHVAFRHTPGTQQFKPKVGSSSGALEKVCIACEEVSFTLPKDEDVLRQVIEAIFEVHPYEEPVIQIQEILTTRYKYGSDSDNPNKWWNRPELAWVSPRQRQAI